LGTGTTTGGFKGQLGVIDTREIECTRGLRLVHVETEWPSVQGGGVDSRGREIGCVHLWHHVVMKRAGHVLEEWVPIDVQSCRVKSVPVRPRGAVHIGRHEMNSFDGVIKVGQIDVHITIVHGLILDLCNEEFVLSLDEMIALIGIEIHVRSVNLGCGVGCEIRAALDANLDGMVLKSNEGQRLGPIFTEEEGDHVIVGTCTRCGTRPGVVTHLTCGDGARGL